MRIILAIFIASIAIAAAHTDDIVDEVTTPLVTQDDMAPEDNLMALAKSLKVAAKGTRYHSHGKNIVYHAQLLQAKKARAYSHKLAATNAIKAAIRALTSELTTGHNHDKHALNQDKSRGNSAIMVATNKGVTTCAKYRQKACPTKKRESDANKKKAAAKAAQTAIKKAKVCPISTTFLDMGVRNPTPRFGTVLRNAWDKQRGNYLKRTAQYNAAKKAHDKAARTHNVAMAQFKTALKIEADAAHAACKNAHKQYNVLKNDIRKNVAMRKQVYIATLVITCYVDNIRSNGAAKGCADKQRKASTSMWNIRFPSLNKCHSSAVLQAKFGPVSWRPTSKNCGIHWHHGAKLSCRVGGRSSNHAGVIVASPPGGHVMTGGGIINRYNHFNKLAAFEESYPHGGTWRCDTGFGAGRLSCYAIGCSTNVGKLSCHNRAARKNGSGSMYVGAPAGYQVTGCGMYNHYRSWNKHATFENIYPSGNGCRGDMGTGSGHFTVYGTFCKAPSGYNLQCKTVGGPRTRKSGTSVVGCPAGYARTGCGIQNHYGGWNHHQAIEQLGAPTVTNKCVCDMGFGWGDFTCFARCCKL